MAKITLNAQPRSTVGRSVKQLRRQGWIPAVVYGHNTPTVAIQVQEADIEHTLRSAGFTHLIELAIANGSEAGKQMVIVREVQRHPIRRSLLHVDFYRVVMTEKLRLEVPVHLVGESPAVKEGATLVQNLNAIEIECLPADIPEAIQIDLSGLTLAAHSITVGDVAVPPRVQVITDPETVIVSVVAARAAEEEEEAAAEAAAEEPEVVAKGKAAKGEEAPEEE